MIETLATLLGSWLRAKILAWVFTHADERFFVRQLSGILDEDAANLSRELSRLESLGVLAVAREGNLKYYGVKKDGPLFNEIKGLVLKTAGVEGACRGVFGKLPGVFFAFIYGSYATRTETADSDIDVMVICEAGIESLDGAARVLEQTLGRPVSVTSYSLAEFKTARKKRDGFVADVIKGKKLMLVGDERDLAKT
jgi:predicted nucleotidyltransferase